MKQINRYATFWIKDLHQNIIEHSCDPQKINNICVNDKPDAPFDITPVFFKREVLDKFYHAPHKYSVSDGEVNYKEEGLFLRVDTDMKDYVAVLLIDLAGLDYEEQLYWRSFNFKPDNTTTVSKAAYERWYEGLFANSEAPDAVLVKEYSEFYSSWKNIIGWPLFKENPQDPNSMLYSVHILTDENNEKEFYDQILVVSKLFIESLNVNQFPKLEENNNQSLKRFSAYLDQYHLSIPEVIEFLRNIQRLRSSKAAHSGKVEKKIAEYFMMDQHSYGYVLNSIFATLVHILDCLWRVAVRIKINN